jgi:hypothetical protein
MDGWVDERIGGWNGGPMDASLAPYCFDGFYSYSVFKTLSVIGRSPMNMNVSAPKIRSLQVSPMKSKW